MDRNRGAISAYRAALLGRVITTFNVGRIIPLIVYSTSRFSAVIKSSEDFKRAITEGKITVLLSAQNNMRDTEREIIATGN